MIMESKKVIWLQVEDELREDMRKTISEYKHDLEGVTKAWDWAQQKV